nr:His/Gly/Thr/Pro-type tRNA ligase C-terminal domain-containing protein [Oenococcus oeni]
MRKNGVSADKNYQDVKVGSQIKEAIRRKTRYYAVIGKKEVGEGKFELSKVDSDQTQTVSVKEFEDNPTKFLS